jgi:hypothetical protein
VIDYIPAETEGARKGRQTYRRNRERLLSDPEAIRLWRRVVRLWSDGQHALCHLLPSFQGCEERDCTLVNRETAVEAYHAAEAERQEIRWRIMERCGVTWGHLKSLDRYVLRLMGEERRAPEAAAEAGDQRFRPEDRAALAAFHVTA